MQSRDFCFWLNGFFEIGDAKALTVEQVDVIKKHLGLVFKHEIDPSFGGPEKQKELNDIHGPSKLGGLSGNSGTGKDTLLRC